MSLFVLAVLTGPYSILDIDTYRPLIVAVRAAEMVNGIGTAILAEMYVRKNVPLFKALGRSDENS